MPERALMRHRIKAGESIRSVATLRGTTPLRLMELNPYVDPTALVAGQELNLPPAFRAALWPFTARLSYEERKYATGPPRQGTAGGAAPGPPPGG